MDEWREDVEEEAAFFIIRILDITSEVPEHYDRKQSKSKSTIKRR